MGSPLDLAFFLSQVPSFLCSSPTRLVSPFYLSPCSGNFVSSSVQILLLSKLSLCVTLMDYVMLLCGDMVSFLPFHPWYSQLIDEDIWKPQVLSCYAELTDAPTFLWVPPDEWVIPDLKETRTWANGTGTSFSIALPPALYIPFSPLISSLSHPLSSDSCHNVTNKALLTSTSFSELLRKTLSLALDSVG